MEFPYTATTTRLILPTFLGCTRKTTENIMSFTMPFAPREQAS